MNKTIKIIDLFNKIAKGEEVPKKIKYDDTIFWLRENNVYTAKDNVDRLLDHIYYDLSNINDEVEIIEESEQDIDIQAIEEIELIERGNKVRYKNDISEYAVRVIDVDMMLKINEILQAVKKLDNKIKEK